MAVREVLRMGHPLLHQVAQPVEQFNTLELDMLIKDMFDTMDAMKGAGLAAPQIGVSLRVVIFGVEANPRYPDVEPVPTTVLIHPQITVLGEETQEDWEGCLSVPGLRGMVPRWNRIRYDGADIKGKPLECEVSGFHARVVQHEVDHLDGILYPERIRDMRTFGFERELFPEVFGDAAVPIGDD
ncbi:MAG: peptide deformylase [Pseudomonadota bacterium]|nr:MAG: peptide deformylase [Pseudomonadota bacterium]